MCLLIRNQRFQSSPPRTPTIPKKVIPPIRCAAFRFDLSQCPVNTPMSVVAMREWYEGFPPGHLCHRRDGQQKVGVISHEFTWAQLESSFRKAYRKF